MAASELVLNDVLCFLKCRFGKIAIKPLKSSVLDFYKTEDICGAKAQLLRDVQQLNLDDLPHIPDRRASNDQAVRVVDDIFVLLTCVDEQLKMKDLPCYVSSSPDRMPATRLYEGDMSVLMNLLTKMDGHIIDNGSVMAAIANDICTLREAQKSVTIDLEQVRRSVNNNTYDQRSVAVTAGNSTQLSSQALVRSADDQTAASSQQLVQHFDWAAAASLTSSPVVQSNRFTVLDDEGDSGSDARPFSEVVSRRSLKRRRQLSSQPPPPQQQRSSATQSIGEQSRPQQSSQRQQSKRFLLGKSTVDSISLAAAKPIKKKAVFCLDNISPSFSADDVRAYVASMSIDVVSCFQVQPRRFRYGASYDRRAFRLCIFEEDCDRLLDEGKWPDSVVISKWYHKSATGDRLQQSEHQRDVPAARNSNVLSAGDAMTSTTSTAASASASSAASVIAPATAGATADTEPSAAMNDNMDTTLLYHNGASGSTSTE